ncbi:protein ALP1-like [Salvia splendens]|uniref:protein ALP1-like n=1 Tax=Salvia splendens TaxID=180675 RepID=UPI001C27BC51|nr:protein ALP1-like [Salvia splendens]
MFDEYLHVGDTTGRECLAKFCEGEVDAFGATYLCKPNTEDCQFLMGMHDRVHDFPGMLGSIDCMDREWKNCPAAWRGLTSGYKGTHPTMILEAIVDHRLWIWHDHFGVAGSNNDINVLNTSSLFTEQCNGNSPVIEFTTNGRQHHMGYYLADGIYPRWLVFLKTISCPTDPKRAFFAQRQESARKDVERGFGVLLARWAIVKGPTRSSYRYHIANVMYACIILHNMIIHDEGTRAGDWSDDEADRAQVMQPHRPFEVYPMESVKD